MSANRKMNAAMKGSLSCEDSGMEEYIMKLVPLGDRVVIKALVAEETTKSGIVLLGQAKEKPQQAEVIAVGLAELLMVRKLLCRLSLVIRLFILSILEQRLNLMKMRISSL